MNSEKVYWVIWIAESKDGDAMGMNLIKFSLNSSIVSKSLDG